MHEIDGRYPSSPARKKDEGQSITRNVRSEGTIIRQTSRLRQFIREYTFISVIAGVMIFIAVELFVNSNIIFPSIATVGKIIANASLISSLSITALLSVSFLLMLKRQMLLPGYRGIMLSVLTVLSVLLVISTRHPSCLHPWALRYRGSCRRGPPPALDSASSWGSADTQVRRILCRRLVRPCHRSPTWYPTASQLLLTFYVPQSERGPNLL